MKYKIVEKRFVRNNGKEDSVFFIKEKVLNLMWWFYYERLDYDDSDKKMEILEKLILAAGVLLPTMITIGILISNGYKKSYLFFMIYGIFGIITNYIYNYKKSISYKTYIDAETALKNAIKKEKFRDITLDVVEITTNDNKIIFEKRK